MSEIEKMRDKLVSELAAYPSKDERFKALVDKGKNMESPQSELLVDKFLIKGCVSRAWLIPSYKDGVLHFYGDSEAMIVKGIMAAILEVYSGHSPSDVLALDPSFLKEAGVEEALSMNRRSGLANILKQIKIYAATFKALHMQ